MVRVNWWASLKDKGRIMTPAQKELLKELQDFAASAPTSQALMERVAKRLHEKMARYNWVGFYLVDPADPNYLVVGPFTGSFTPNARFPLNVGLCGSAATSGKVVVVQDVSTDPRYLAGSSLVKSEIVVPVFVHGKVAGELDIDSHFHAAFGPDDRKLCEHAAALLGTFMGSHP